MERFPSSMDYVNMMAKLGDLKDEHYRNTLALSTIIELLIDKGILTRDLFFDVTADAVGMLVPGGSIAVKLVKAVVDRGKK